MSLHLSKYQVVRNHMSRLTSRLLITFAIRLESDPKPDLDPILFDTQMGFMKEFFLKKWLNFEKSQQTKKKHEKLPRRQRVNLITEILKY